MYLDISSKNTPFSILFDGVNARGYTGLLNRFRIRIELNRIRVNALIQIVNRFT